MEEALERTIRAIHASPARCVLAATGAGSQGIAWLLAVPGASETVLDARIPYSQAALGEFLGATPQQFVSALTASQMAGRALGEARRLAGSVTPVLGVGCTGALATSRPRRGEHRVHVCVERDDRSSSCSLRLAKGARSREEEEQVCSLLLIHALALGCGVIPAFELPLLAGEEIAAEGDLSPLYDLFQGRTGLLVVAPDGRVEADGPRAGGVLPGAFNPLHEGHRRLAEVASEVLDAPVTFELSLENVDKKPLSEGETLRRARQFSGWGWLALTRAPTFREKARLVPGCTFVIGYDTAVRVVAPRYYGGDEEMLEALREIRDLGCSFLVAGRAEGAAFHTLAEVPIPPEYRPIFREIPPERFRLDISSTELRTRAGGEKRFDLRQGRAGSDGGPLPARADGRSPAGKPVGQAVALPDHDQEPVKRALAAIDATHGDGVLPTAQVVYAKMEDLGEFDVLATGDLVIGLTDRMVQTGFTTAHEVGHFVARFGLGSGDKDPNVDGNNAAVMEFQRLAARTKAVKEVERLAKADLGDETAFRLWKQPDIFARAYAQYVTAKSGDAALLGQLEETRQRLVDRKGLKVYYPEQWADEDFEPLMEWFDSEFTARGWLQ